MPLPGTQDRNKLVFGLECHHRRSSLLHSKSPRVAEAAICVDRWVGFAQNMLVPPWSSHLYKTRVLVCLVVVLFVVPLFDIPSSVDK